MEFFLVSCPPIFSLGRKFLLLGGGEYCPKLSPLLAGLSVPFFCGVPPLLFFDFETVLSATQALLFFGSAVFFFSFLFSFSGVSFPRSIQDRFSLSPASSTLRLPALGKFFFLAWAVS